MILISKKCHFPPKPKLTMVSHKQERYKKWASSNATMSVSQTVLLSGSFLEFGSLVFSKSQHGVRGLLDVVRHRAELDFF